MTGAYTFTAAVIVQKPSLVADILIRADAGEAVALLQRQSEANAALVMASMLPWAAGRLLGAMKPAHAAAIVAEMTAQAAVDILKTMDEQSRLDLVAALPERIAKAVSDSLTYRPSQVGAWISRQIPVLHVGDKVGDVGKIPELEGHEQQIYIATAEHQLQGVIPVTRLFEAAPETPLALLVEAGISPLVDTAHISRAANDPAWDDFLRLPVVNQDGRLVGDISRKALRAAAEQAGALTIDLEAHSMLGALSIAYLATAGGLLQIAVEPSADGGPP